MSLDRYSEMQNQRPQREQPYGEGKEKLKLSSGICLAIDQFMLGNQQLLTLCERWTTEEAAVAERAELTNVLKEFGGCVFELGAGDFLVGRNPEQTVIFIYPASKENEPTAEEVLGAKSEAEPTGRVLVDTRCVVFIDLAVMGRKALLEEYKQLRRNGEDKRGRDMLRENGGAVRYGFQKYGDELGVFRLPSSGVVALWPDVVEGA